MPRPRPPEPAPDIADGTILFDGICVLCSGWARYVARRDAAGRFCFVPLQSAYGRALASRFGLDPEDPATALVVLDGRAHFELDMVPAILGGLPGWNWGRILAILPGFARARLYRLIADNRYRWFGRRQTCLMPGEAGLGARVSTEPPAPPAPPERPYTEGGGPPKEAATASRLGKDETRA